MGFVRLFVAKNGENVRMSGRKTGKLTRGARDTMARMMSCSSPPWRLVRGPKWRKFSFSVELLRFSEHARMSHDFWNGSKSFKMCHCITFSLFVLLVLRFLLDLCNCSLASLTGHNLSELLLSDGVIRVGDEILAYFSESKGNSGVAF